MIGVGTLGTLAGSIAAARNVGDLFTYSNFASNVTASNSVNETDQGRIGNVVSFGELAGSLVAAYSIGTLHSGDAVTASYSAPNVGSVFQFDTSLFTTYLTPSAPAAIGPDVLADAADAKADILADKAAFQASAGLFVSDIQASRADLLSDIAASRAEVVTDNADIAAETQTAIDDARLAALSDLVDARMDALDDRAEFVALVATQRTALQSSWAQTAAENQQAFDDSVQNAIDIKDEDEAKRLEVGQDRATTFNEAHDRMIEDRDWYTQNLTAWGAMASQLNPMVAIPALITHISELHQQMTENADELGLDGLEREYFINGNVLADLVGARSVIGAAFGEDPFTLEKWSDGYRLFQFVTGSAQLVETASGVSMIASRMASPCKSWHWGTCFVGDTLVVVGMDEDFPATIAEASMQASTQESNTESAELPLYFVTIGLAGFYMSQRKSKTRDRRSRTCNKPPAYNPLKRDPMSNQLMTTSHLATQLSSVSTSTGDERKPKCHGPVECAFSEGEFSSQPGNHDPVHSDQVFATLELKPETHFTPDQDQHTSWAEESYALEAEPETDLEQHRFSPTFGTTWLMTWVFLALGWLLPIPTAKDFVPQQAAASTSTATTTEKPSTGLRYRQIQDIRTGMRVIAKNPELEGQYLPDTEFDPPNCRNIHLRMKKPDGSDLHITLLRSVEWLQQRARRWTLEELETTAQSDSPAKPEIILDLAEIGAAGPATVLAVEPCPNIEHGPGRVVTGTFHHSSAEVIDLYVTGEERPIGTTANHPFWSETRNDFVQAGSLKLREELSTVLPGRVCVKRSRKKAIHCDVYNLEVDGLHAYLVSHAGIIVHNSDDYNLLNPPHEGPVNRSHARAHGLGDRDPNWPWHGLHSTERHHPIMQGAAYRQFWTDRGVNNADIDGFTVDIDVDVHQAMTNSGWWDSQMFGRIAEVESTLGRLANLAEIKKIANDLLGIVQSWTPSP